MSFSLSVSGAPPEHAHQQLLDQIDEQIRTEDITPEDAAKAQVAARLAPQARDALEVPEGATVEVSASGDASKFSLTVSVSGSSPPPPRSKR